MKEQLKRRLVNVKKHSDKGIFITFEGGEGVGKSTVAKMVEERLISLKKEVFLTREPGGTELKFAEEIREIIMQHKDIDPITELLLFNASRREHLVKKIIPNLKKGKIVISDRFSDSTLVYQAIVKGVSLQTFNKANEISVGESAPTFVFIFDLDPKIGMERISLSNKKTNRFDIEGIDFHKKVREAYLKLYQSDMRKYILIDASRTPQEITEIILEKILEYGS